MSDENVFAPGADFSRKRPEWSEEPPPVDLMPIFERAWKLLLDNLATVGIGVAVLIGISLAQIGIGTSVTFWAISTGDEQMINMAQLIQNLVSIPFGILSLFVQLGMYRMLLDIDRGSEGNLEALWSQGGLLIGAIVIGILIALGVGLGMLLLIVPGIIVALGLSLSMMVYVDRGEDPIAALSESWSLTDGHKLFLFLQGLVMFVMYIVTACVSCGLAVPIWQGFFLCVQVVTYNAILNTRQ